MVVEDNNPFSKEVPLTIGTKTEDTILEALKEGEIEVLDNIWKRVKIIGNCLSCKKKLELGRLWFGWPRPMGKNLLSSKIIYLTQTKEWRTFLN